MLVSRVSGRGSEDPAAPETGAWRLFPSVVLASVTIVLLALTAVGTLAMRSVLAEENREAIEHAVGSAMDAINLQVQASIGEVTAIRSLFDASEQVTRHEFRAFVSGFLNEAQGVQALEWIPRVLAADREAFEMELRASLGIAEASIHPERAADEYFPVAFVEPLAGNESAVGFDLGSNPARMAALNEARDSGRPTATEHITLVQEAEAQFAFLLFVPVYEGGGVPATVGERREALAGFSLGVFRFGDFLEAALPPSFHSELGLVVSDRAVDGVPHRLFSTEEDAERLLDAADVTVERSIEIAGQRLDLTFVGPRGFGVSGILLYGWLVVLVGGVVFAGVVFASGRLLMRGRQRALLAAAKLQLSNDEIGQRETAYAALLHGTHDLIQSSDAEAKLQFVNRAWIERLGYTERETHGMTVWDVIHPDSLEHCRGVFAGIMTGDVREFRATFQAKDGTPIEVEGVGSIRTRPDGPPVTQTYLKDVTARMRAEADLTALNATLEHRVEERTSQLEAANAELESFAYSVSHDLRAPLRGIDGFSLALLREYEDKLDDTGKEYLHWVRDASQEMGRLIDDILRLSRVFRSDMIIEPVDLGAIARGIADELRETDGARAVEFTIVESAVAVADERLIHIALENLLRNAWKFTSRHEHAGIEFGVEAREGGPVYFVRDDGAGFDMDYADKLFQPFQRLHSVGEFEGTGVGLAIVHRIIARHGGKIWAEGAVEEGATFYFTRPGGNQGGTA